MSKCVFLLCNAHLDPVWQWEWEEGAAEALSTFRIAADFCEEYPDFIFCHNEALLYQWIEKFDPPLFERIRTLVKRGQWHIMGGWHLQPDCNMPSGEAFVRQILAGRNYFAEKFDAFPTVAVNVDPFGHTRGLVQIMAKSGYTGYLFMRPDENHLTLPAEQFRWVGYDGSEVLGVRMLGGYASYKGRALEKAVHYMQECPENGNQLCLWGVGNHGGGPSKKDLDDLTDLIAKEAAEGNEMLHSTPEAYFATLEGKNLPPFSASLNSWAPGCYTSQIRIKQTYRRAENTYLLTETMAAHAANAGLMEFPTAELKDALYDINTVQFHDMLPGSSIQPAEEMSLRMLDHGLETLSRVKAHAFFALAAGQAKSAEDTIPIFVYNPYPYTVTTDVIAEFMLWDQNWKLEFLQPIVYDEKGQVCPSQCEKEHSNLPLEWRKRVVFRATLAPMTMNRFACGFETLEQKPAPTAPEEDGYFCLTGGGKTLKIDRRTGWIADWYDADRHYLTDGAMTLEVFRDNHDPWFMEAHEWLEKIGEFTLLSPEETAEYCCLNAPIPAVHVIESGDVRTVVEAVFGYKTSRAVVQYLFSADGTLDVKVRLNWNEKQRMARLRLPTTFDSTCIGEQAYGAEALPENMKEGAAGRYHLLCGEACAVAIANNGTYGAAFDREGKTLHITLLRSPGYCAHPIADRTVMPQDRYMPYIEQGERDYAFRLTAGDVATQAESAPRMAQLFNMAPMALSFYPTGTGEKPSVPMVLKETHIVQWTALKQAEDGDGWVVRLFNPTAQAQTATLQFADAEVALTFGAYEIKSVRYQNGTLHETDLLERPI